MLRQFCGENCIALDAMEQLGTGGLQERVNVIARAKLRNCETAILLLGRRNFAVGSTSRRVESRAGGQVMPRVMRWLPSSVADVMKNRIKSIPDTARLTSAITARSKQTAADVAGGILLPAPRKIKAVVRAPPPELTTSWIPGVRASKSFPFTSD